MAFSMVAWGMLAALASSMTYRSERLSRGSGPPLAATMIFLAILPQILPRFLSMPAFLCLMFAQ